MLPALLTTLLWSICIVAARRSVEQLGENAANFLRLVLAVTVLGAIAHGVGGGLAGAGLMFFMLSGMVGFGLGDIGGFHALPRIGSRLTILLSQCVAAPIAGLTEWSWLGTTLSGAEVLAIAVLLGGVAIALLPDRSQIPADGMKGFLAGVAFGLLAAFGQGMGAVLSRKGYMMAEQANQWVVRGAEQGSLTGSILFGATTGYQRLIGGLILVALFTAFSRVYAPWRTHPSPARAGDSRASVAGFIALNAFTGPIIGIICFQWALSTTPSAIVQPIVALTPLTVIPFAWWLEGDRPTRRSVIGAVIAVAGVLMLAMAE